MLSIFLKQKTFLILYFLSIDTQTPGKMKIHHRKLCRKLWTNDEKDVSLRLYYLSPSAYKYLDQIISIYLGYIGLHIEMKLLNLNLAIVLGYRNNSFWNIQKF